MMKSLVGIMWIVLVLISGCSGNPDAKRLYDDLLSNYNKLVRPVVNVTDALTVKIKLKLSQLIDVNLKNQIMTTNLWVEQSWYDYKLQWDPKEYGGVEMLHVPSDHIWRPDIVLYNNADGNFEVTLATKATLNYTGRVDWKPPAIYKSSCEIDVEYFPFDEQTCVMKFGSWTYDGFQVDLRHIDEVRGSNVVNIGVDLSEFYTSVEWDILEVPAVSCRYKERIAVCTLLGVQSEDFLANLHLDDWPSVLGRFGPFYIYETPVEINVRDNYRGDDDDWHRLNCSQCGNNTKICMGKGRALFGPAPKDFKTPESTIRGVTRPLTFLFAEGLSNKIPVTSQDTGKAINKLNEKFYTCCDEPYLDITFNITMRRKTLFYTVNLIIPCMGISFLTVLVFYLPSDSGEKVSLSISILLSLTVFFLLLAEIIPPTSLVVPLLGKFVLFTMILDTFSICVTVVVLNVHFRSPQTHVMAPWVRRVFIHVLPRLLVMRRPQYQIDKRTLDPHHSQRVMVRTCNGLELRDPSLFVEASASELVESSVLFPSVDSRDELNPRELEAINLGSTCRIHGSPAAAPPPPQLPTEDSVDALCNALHNWHHCPELYKAIEAIRFIADHTKREEDSTRVKEDWKYVAMVLDRLFLWIFTLAVVVGTAGIILQAPTLYDDRIPIDVRLSEIASTTAKPHIVTNL